MKSYRGPRNSKRMDVNELACFKLFMFKWDERRNGVRISETETECPIARRDNGPAYMYIYGHIISLSRIYYKVKITCDD